MAVHVSLHVTSTLIYVPACLIFYMLCTAGAPAMSTELLLSYYVCCQDAAFHEDRLPTALYPQVSGSRQPAEQIHVIGECIMVWFLCWMDVCVCCCFFFQQYEATCCWLLCSCNVHLTCVHVHVHKHVPVHVRVSAAYTCIAFDYMYNLYDAVLVCVNLQFVIYTLYGNFSNWIHQL